MAIRARYGLFYEIVELQDVRTFVRNPPFGEVIDLRGDANANSTSSAALRVGPGRVSSSRSESIGTPTISNGTSRFKER